MVKGNPYKKINTVSRQKHEEKKEDNDSKPELLGSFSSSITLHMLQDKIKRQPEMYRNEFAQHLEIFQSKLESFKESPGKKDDEMDEYFKFMAHISGVFKEELAEYLCNEFINLLQQYYSILNPVMRMTLVTCLRIMRGKDIVSPSIVLPVLLKLFRCEDK